MSTGVTRLASRGTLVVVVGPSGAGKDTLITRALERFSGHDDVHVVRRVITRAEDAGGENHTGVAAGEFEAMRQKGAFAVDWDAHGLSYGIPSCVHDKLAIGQLVIVNGSRSALSRFAAVFDPMLVVNVIARPEVLAQRLEARGRESREEILRRLKRSSLEVRGPFNVVTIDNSGDLTTAAEQLMGTLAPLLPQR
jgi:phosphonate metabolism protein/1,5-bisphosphokinase (PRPP-forming) PhnN